MDKVGIYFSKNSILQGSTAIWLKSNGRIMTEVRKR